MYYKRTINNNLTQQLNLGELIKILKSFEFLDEVEKTEQVVFDFGYFSPTSLCSWRGAYEELAIDYDDVDYEKIINLKQFIELLENAVGKSFEGWKGGMFTMHEDTPLWVSKPHQACDTAVVGVTYAGYKYIINTAYCEY